jgi:hypothetical protein
MGYTTNFFGRFKLNKPLDPALHVYLVKFNETRRMARNLGPEYGVEGEFFVDGAGFLGQDCDSSVINENKPPNIQPGLWCQWRPTEDGKSIKWDGGEKFYHYVEWLEYIIKNFLAPKDYLLNGAVRWKGDDHTDTGVILVIDNLILTISTKTYTKIQSMLKGTPKDPRVRRQNLSRFLKNPLNLPLLMGLDEDLDKWIATRMRTTP